ncbi:MAG TPA: zinc-binding dehydrogenase [Candidatus Dormibacteraeota bacterium]
MKAAIHREHGPAEVLRVEDVPDPDCGPGEVLIAVRAAGLNRLDVLQRQGPALIPNFSLPHIPGMDVAGEVTAIGPEVNAVRVGERVVVNPALHCGHCDACLGGDDGLCPHVRVVGGNHPGGFAQWCVVPETHVISIPEGMTDSEACAFPTNYSTAWHGLVVTGRLQVGETVMIHGSGSGVSIAAIQIAKRAGAQVIATSGSARKLEAAHRLGADAVINHESGNLVAEARAATLGRGVDMVLDHVGPALFQASILSLRPHGRLVFCGTTTGNQACFNLPFAYHFGISLLGVDPYRYREFDEMLRWCWRADLHPVIDTEFALADVVGAQHRMERGESIGKIVLRP